MSHIIRESIDFYRQHLEKSRKLSQKKKNALMAVGLFDSNGEKGRDSG